MAVCLDYTALLIATQSHSEEAGSPFVPHYVSPLCQPCQLMNLEHLVWSQTGLGALPVLVDIMAP